MAELEQSQDEPFSELKQQWEGGTLVVMLPEDLTSKESEGLKQLFREQLRKETLNFVLDASGLSFVDSVGIGTLVKLLKESRAVGGDLVVRNLKGHPYKVFKQARLDWVITVQSGSETFMAKQDLFPRIEMPVLELRYEPSGDVGIFHLSGMMCYPHGVRKFKEDVLVALADKRKILLDFEGLKFLDIPSINEIFNIYFILRSSEGDLRFARAEGLTRDILRNFGVPSWINEYETLEKALARW